MARKNENYNNIENEKTTNDRNEHIDDYSQDWYNDDLVTILGDLHSLIKEMCENEVVHVLDKPKPHNISDFISLVKSYVY